MLTLKSLNNHRRSSSRIFHTGIIRLSVFLFILAGVANCANQHQDPLLTLLDTNQTGTPVVLIIGDSLTDYSRGFSLQSMLGVAYQVAYQATPNRDIPYWTLRLDEALAIAGEQPPAHIIIPMGTNDAYLYQPATFLSNLQALHAGLRLRTSAILYYCQVPRTRDASLAPAILANNQKLKDNLPADGTRLIDLDEAMQSAPDPAFFYPSNDPIHPTDAGYRRMGRAMQFSILDSTDF